MAAADPIREAILDALPEVRTWTDRPTEADLAPLPGCAALFLFVDEHGRPIQLLTTQQLKRQVVSRLTEPDEARRGRTDLAAVARGVRWRAVHSRFEARWRYYRLARVLHPKTYRKMASFGSVSFLCVDWQRPIPEIAISERIWATPGEFLGPWPTQRSCRLALERLWDLFDLCRYGEQVRATPNGRRCAYYDMGRCDAPCDGTAPLAPYVKRVRTAWRFASSGADAWIAQAEADMLAAAGAQEFERAGAIKRQIDAARTWIKDRPPDARRENYLQWLLLIPVARRRAWKPFVFRLGDLIDGPVIAERKLAGDLKKWLTGSLGQPPATHLDAAIRMEQTWLVAHLLGHKDRQAAIVTPISGNESLADALVEHVMAALHERKASDAADAADADHGVSSSFSESESASASSDDVSA